MSKKALAAALLSVAAVVAVTAYVYRYRQLRTPIPLILPREPEPPAEAVKEPGPADEEVEPEEPSGPKPLMELAERALNALHRIGFHHGPPPVAELADHEEDLAAVEELMQRTDNAILDPELNPESSWLSKLFKHVSHRHFDWPLHGFEFNFQPIDRFRILLKALKGGRLLDTRAAAWLEGILRELFDRDELGPRYLDPAELQDYVTDEELVRRLEEAAKLPGQDNPSGF